MRGRIWHVCLTKSAATQNARISPNWGLEDQYAQRVRVEGARYTVVFFRAAETPNGLNKGPQEGDHFLAPLPSFGTIG